MEIESLKLHYSYAGQETPGWTRNGHSPTTDHPSVTIFTRTAALRGAKIFPDIRTPLVSDLSKNKH